MTNAKSILWFILMSLLFTSCQSGKIARLTMQVDNLKEGKIKLEDDISDLEQEVETLTKHKNKLCIDSTRLQERLIGCKKLEKKNVRIARLEERKVVREQIANIEEAQEVDDNFNIGFDQKKAEGKVAPQSKIDVRAIGENKRTLRVAAKLGYEGFVHTKDNKTKVGLGSGKYDSDMMKNQLQFLKDSIKALIRQKGLGPENISFEIKGSADGQPIDKVNGLKYSSDSSAEHMRYFLNGDSSTIERDALKKDRIRNNHDLAFYRMAFTYLNYFQTDSIFNSDSCDYKLSVDTSQQVNEDYRSIEVVINIKDGLGEKQEVVQLDREPNYKCKGQKNMNNKELAVTTYHTVTFQTKKNADVLCILPRNDFLTDGYQSKEVLIVKIGLEPLQCKLLFGEYQVWLEKRGEVIYPDKEIRTVEYNNNTRVIDL